MRTDEPARDVARSEFFERGQQIGLAIEHLQAALDVIDGHGGSPDIGARIEECIYGLRELLDRED